MAMAVLRLPEVLRRTGLCRTSIYNRVTAGEFPGGFSLGGSSRGWLESEGTNRSQRASQRVMTNAAPVGAVLVTGPGRGHALVRARL